jgi:hypothetical protein
MLRPASDKPDEAERVESLLLGPAEYRTQVVGAPGPRFLHASRGGQHVFYAGLEHTSDPADPALVRLEDLWQRFLSSTQGSDRAALIEGRLRALQPTREDAVIKSGGEGGLVTLLAHRAGVALACPEPDPHRQLATLKARFGEEACLAFWARTALLWQRQAPASPLEDTLRDLWGADTAGGELSREAVSRVHQRLFGTPLDEGAREHLLRLADPLADGPVSRVLREDTRARDTQVVLEIARRWRAGQSLFVAYGASHAVVQERALRALLCPDEAGEDCRFERVS